MQYRELSCAKFESAIQHCTCTEQSLKISASPALADGTRATTPSDASGSAPKQSARWTSQSCYESSSAGSPRSLPGHLRRTGWV